MKSTEEKAAIKQYALYYHKDIVNILDEIKRELLLVLKTNNYLRSIDNRLGNPNNTFNIIVINIQIKYNYRTRQLGKYTIVK